MITLHDTRDLLTHQLRALRGAGNLLLNTLPAVARRVGSPSLRVVVEELLASVRDQQMRIEQAAEIAALPCSPVECPAMDGLMRETIDALTAEGELSARDAAVVVSLQRASHYLIAGYELAITHARLLGFDRMIIPLSRSLHEHEHADEALGDIVELEMHGQAIALGVAPVIH